MYSAVPLAKISLAFSISAVVPAPAEKNTFSKLFAQKLINFVFATSCDGILISFIPSDAILLALNFSPYHLSLFSIVEL